MMDNLSGLLANVGNSYQSGTPGYVSDGTPGGAGIGLFMAPTATTGYNYRVLRGEAKANIQGAANNNGIVGVRGCTTIPTACTYSAATGTQGYLFGTQGKLVVTGTLGLATSGNAGTVFACAMLAQVNTSGGTIDSAQEIYGLWVDHQSSSATLPTLSHLVNLTNNGSAWTNLFKVYGNFSYFADVQPTGGTWVVTTFAGNASEQTKALKVRYNGADWYIPMQSAAS